MKLYLLTFADTRVAGHRHLNRDQLDSRHPKNCGIIAKTIIKSLWGDPSRFAVAWTVVVRVGRFVASIFNQVLLVNASIEYKWFVYS